MELWEKYRDQIGVVEVAASGGRVVLGEELMRVAGCGRGSCGAVTVALVRRGEKLVVLFPKRDMKEMFFYAVREKYPDAVFVRVGWCEACSVPRVCLIYVA